MLVNYHYQVLMDEFTLEDQWNCMKFILHMLDCSGHVTCPQHPLAQWCCRYIFVSQQVILYT